MHRGGFRQPHVPVDPGAFVPPPFRMRCVDADRDAVERLAKAGDVGDVDGERRVAAEVAVEQMAVDPDRAVRRNAVKAQREVLAAIGFFELKIAAIPGDPARQESGVHVIRPMERAFNRPIVRQIDFAPIRIVVRLLRRPAREPRLVRHVRRDVLVWQRRIDVAKVEFPTGVEREYSCVLL